MPKTNSDFIIYPVKIFRVMTVYERSHYRKVHWPKYLVVDNRTSKSLEEFRTKAKAFKWALDNKNG